MAAAFGVLVFSVIILSKITSISSSPPHTLSSGSSLSVENKDDILLSPNGLFTAGFHLVGVNAYGFAVWFSEQAAKSSTSSCTVVWMANRDIPVNGKQSKLTLREDGNLVLKDAGDYGGIWSTHTKSTSTSVQLKLQDTGNLVLYEGRQPLWQSFDHPTDTLLPNQPFTKNTKLVSPTSAANYSSGFYKLFFDNDSILRLLYDGPEATAVYWPDPRAKSSQSRRFRYIYSRSASLDSNGQFNSSDGLKFKTADFGMGPKRMMRIDTDGNLRVYSLVEHGRRNRWEVQWQAFSQSCKIHGVCGPNSLCTYSSSSGRKCTCLHGFKMVKPQDWSYGCEPEFVSCTKDDCDFIELRKVQFYGYDVGLLNNHTLDYCKKNCLQDSTCTGFQFQFITEKSYYSCYKKTTLYNGYQLGRVYSMYIKLPKSLVSSFDENTINESSFNCPHHQLVTPIHRTYKKKHDINSLGFMLVLGCVIGFMEIICIVFCWYETSNTCSATLTEQSYFPAATTFRKFTYNELKKASCNFSEEIGRGGACIVYKGRLSDNRVAAIKRLKNTNHQGEAEFQAEISTIGRVNHMNLIETWGYCAEGKHRLVVYEYMENGSLAEVLGLGKLDWATRFDIAIGTAKGLAYLHDECLEWVLHCDVKPHNILLDVNYNPKVADFGLSKLLDRGSIDQWNFSMIRGTRGYMAPEWVFNLPITSKVDVFSYGVVILEMITGRSPTATHQTCHENVVTDCTLIDWARDRIQGFEGSRMESWVEEIVDPSISGVYDQTVMENLVRVALQCVEDDREARPSMSQVVDMLLHV